MTWSTKDHSDAYFSPCRTWRYSLVRSWSAPGAKILVVVGLNPSTADETENDPTVRRCLGYAKAWGYSTLRMLNLFAFRSTDPKGLRATADPVGPDTDRVLVDLCAGQDVLAAWGGHGRLLDRDVAVLRLLEKAGARVSCLAENQDGTPVHPLYQKKDAVRAPYDGKKRWLEAGLRSGGVTITESFGSHALGLPPPSGPMPTIDTERLTGGALTPPEGLAIFANFAPFAANAAPPTKRFGRDLVPSSEDPTRAPGPESCPQTSPDGQQECDLVSGHAGLCSWHVRRQRARSGVEVALVPDPRVVRVLQEKFHGPHEDPPVPSGPAAQAAGLVPPADRAPAHRDGLPSDREPGGRGAPRGPTPEPARRPLPVEAAVADFSPAAPPGLFSFVYFERNVSKSQRRVTRWDRCKVVHVSTDGAITTGISERDAERLFSATSRLRRQDPPAEKEHKAAKKKPKKALQGETMFERATRLMTSSDRAPKKVGAYDYEAGGDGG